MQISHKDRTEGPFHKLKSSFREIFGKSNDTPKFQGTDTTEGTGGNDHEKESVN